MRSNNEHPIFQKFNYLNEFSDFLSLEVWSVSILGGFEINGEFVGSRAGAEQRIDLNFREKVTHVQYGVGYSLKIFRDISVRYSIFYEKILKPLLKKFF